jgi:hypothetical protein
MAGTRLAVPLDRVRATDLTWCRLSGCLPHPGPEISGRRSGSAAITGPPWLHGVCNTGYYARPQPDPERRLGASARWRAETRDVGWASGGSQRLSGNPTKLSQPITPCHRPPEPEARSTSRGARQTADSARPAIRPDGIWDERRAFSYAHLGHGASHRSVRVRLRSARRRIAT